MTNQVNVLVVVIIKIGTIASYLKLQWTQQFSILLLVTKITFQLFSVEKTGFNIKRGGEMVEL